MAVSYKKLWKLLIDKDIKKKDLSAKAGVSPATITKMGKNGHVTTEVLLKICTALGCGIDDIMEITSNEKQHLRGPFYSTISMRELVQANLYCKLFETAMRLNP